jgi:hypothetical protein
MLRSKAWRRAGGRGIALALMLTAGCGCNRKTPVPFKRDAHDAGATVVDAGAPIQMSAEAQSYPDGLSQVRVADTTILRPNGVIYASLARDFDGDQQPDVVIVSSDERAQVQLEVIAHGSARTGAALPLSPEPVATSCRPISAQLGELTGNLLLASVVSLCEPPPDPLTAAISGETAAPSSATAPSTALGTAVPGASGAAPSARLAPGAHAAARENAAPTSASLGARVYNGASAPSTAVNGAPSANTSSDRGASPIAAVPALSPGATQPDVRAGANTTAAVSHAQGTTRNADQAAPNLPAAAPPEPGAGVAITQHYVVRVDGTSTAPQLVLRVAATWSDSDEPLSPDLKITGEDIDGDQQNDVSVTLQLTAAAASLPPKKSSAKNKAPAPKEPAQLTLTWLNRPTGLARERAEPETTLTELANDALKVAPKRPEGGRVLATRALRLHHLLCKESGVAQFWVGGARGVACGVSAAAGKAAAAKAISLALTQQVLPALEARAELDDPALSIDKKTRQQVTTAIGSMRGDTSYQWHAGPNLRAGSAPLLHLPLLGFIDENTLLLRGPTAQSYDLTTRAATPTGIPGSVLATDPKHRYALTDIVRSCGGFHVRSVPAAQVIGGIVTGTPTAEPLLWPAPSSAEASGCSMRPHSDRDGFVLLGMTPSYALFARGRQLIALPFDALGQVTDPPRQIPGSEALPPLSTPGPLDQSGRYLALATSEGVALIDRAQNSARLVRTPASCAGSTVSDAALSPSGRKLAMLCGGRVYVAEPAAVSGAGDRPILEHP